MWEPSHERLLRADGLSPVRGDLRVLDVVYFDFDVFLPPLDRRLARMAVAVREKLELFGRSWLRKLDNGFLIKCIKTM